MVSVGMQRWIMRVRMAKEVMMEMEGLVLIVDCDLDSEWG